MADIDEKDPQIVQMEEPKPPVEAELVSRFAHLSFGQALKVFWKTVIVAFGIFLGAMFDGESPSTVLIIGYAISAPGNISANREFIEKFGTVVINGVKQLDTQHVGAWGGIQSGGQIVGMISGGFTSDRFGRRFNMWLLTGLIVLAVVLQITATNWLFFLFARFFAGWATGLIQTSLTCYVAEIAPTNLRGALLTAYSFWFAVGQFANTVAMQIVNKRGIDYKNVFYSEFIFVGMFVAVLFFIPESPWFYALKGDHEGAKAALRRLNGSIEGYDVDFEYSVIFAEVEKELEMRRQSKQVPVVELFKGINGRRTWISFFPLACQQFVGIPLVFGYLSYFFSLAGVADPFLPAVIINVLLLVFLLVAAMTIHRLGRRRLLLVGIAIMGVCTLCMGVIGSVSGNGPLVSANGLIALGCVWTVAYAMSAGPIGWAYVADTAAPVYRAKTTAFAAAGTCCFGLVFNYTTPLMLSAQNANWGIKTGYFFAAAALVGFIGVFFTVPETTGRTWAELDVLFDQRISARKFHKVHLDEPERVPV